MLLDVKSSLKNDDDSFEFSPEFPQATVTFTSFKPNDQRHLVTEAMLMLDEEELSLEGIDKPDLV